MSNIAMIPSVRHENARALASALGILEIEHAAKLLDVSVLVTVPSGDYAAEELAIDVITLLSRTIDQVACTGIDSPTVEIVMGSAEPRASSAQQVRVAVMGAHATVGTNIFHEGHIADIPPVLRRLVACYVSAVVMKRIVPSLWFPLPDPLKITFDSLGIDLSMLNTEIKLGKAYLAGAGAIGNALLWAMQGLNVSGELHVVDFDQVEDGNLQRQLWFDEKDLKKKKCHCLVEKAQPHFTHLKLIPRDSELQRLPERSAGAWLSKLIVAVDSRRVRRLLQEDILPGEVFDASTTDISEVIVHYHRQPTEHACLSCIYPKDSAENSFEMHIADQLGIPVAKVRESVIDLEAATAISFKYPSEVKAPDAIVGLAYDSLFKSLCGTGKLSRQNESTTIAPFAFVSALAGILLTLELVRRHTEGAHHLTFNYWRVSPWQNPFPRNRRLHPADPSCAVCGNAMAKDVLRELWTGAK